MMTTRDTDLAANATSTLRRNRAALYLTSAIVAAIPTVGQATITPTTTGATTTIAVTTPTPAAADTVAALNAAITTASSTAGVTDLVVNIGNAVTGNATIVAVSTPTLTKSITVSNTAALGSAAGGDFVGIALNGAGSAGGAANTATITNSGVVNGSITAFNFGGNIAISNTGTASATQVQGEGFGDVTYTQDAGATVTNSYAAMSSIMTNASVTASGVTTVTNKNGNATVTINGPAASATVLSVAGDVYSNYNTVATGAAKAVINGSVGGTLYTNIGGFNSSSVVTTPAASVASKDTVTNLVVTTGATTSSDVLIGATGSVGSTIEARGAKGGSVVKISGTVRNGVTSIASNVTDSVETTTTTADAGNVATKIVTVTANTFTGGASTVTVDKGALVGRLAVPAVGVTPAVTLITAGITSTSDTASTVNVDGTVTGSILASATTGANTTSTTTTLPPAGPTTVTVNSGFNASTAAVNIGATGVVGDSATGVGTSVNAFGYSKADITVATGGKMYSTANASSLANLTSSTPTTTSNTTAGVTSTSAVTNNAVAKGGAATITNGSAVQSGALNANGTTAATVTNTGKSGSLVARATTFNQTTTLTDSDSTNVDGKTRVVVNTVVTTANAGVATITNSGVANGSATLQGSGAAASTLSNTGTISGNLNIGAVLNEQTVTTTWAGSATTPLAGTTAAVAAGVPTSQATTASKTLPVQNYVINQNGVVGGGIAITGNVNGTLTNSVVNATVNLGTAGTSVTLGPIFAPQAAITPESITNVNPGLNGQGNLTNTRVNLGTGFLGADFVGGADRTPVIAKDATSIIGSLTANGTPNIGTRILGANSVSKTGAGTFVITGTGTTDAAMGFKGSATVPTTGTGLTVTAGAPPLTTGLTSNPYTIDLGGVSDATANTPQTTNLLSIAAGGELQLTVAGTTPAVFGIRGDIKNDGTLVLGRRMNPAQPTTNVGAIVPTEVIRGITVSQNGNYAQSATGNLVVGIVPQLQGTGGNFLSTGGSGATSLAPVVSGLTANTFAATAACTSFGTAATAANCTTSSPSLLNVKGNLSIAGTITVDGTPNAIYVNGDKQVIANYSGTGDITGAKVAVPNSKYVNFTLGNDATTKQVTLTVARNGYEKTANLNPNAASAALGFNGALTAAIATIKTPLGVTATNFGNAQDVANIASQLDWTLNNAQAQQVFNEMSSAEIYGSLAALDQNAGFSQSLDILTERRSAGTSRGAMSLGAGEGLGARLWLNPTAQFAKYGDRNTNDLGSSGQSQIKANTYGGAMGLDISFSDTGAFGFGVGYAKHDFNNVNTPENGDGSTVTLGAYVTQGFGPIYANVKVAYGFSKFDVSRSMSLLARTAKSSFKGNQFDAALQVGYDLVSGSATITPFAELALRHWKLNGFTETGAAGIGLTSADRSKSVFNPTVGVKFVANTGDPDGFSLRPFGKLAYTFQGDIGNVRTFTYAAGGSFNLAGVNPKGYGTAELGLDATLSNSVGMWLGGSYDFGGRNKVGAIKAGMDFMFGGGRHVEAAPPPPPPMPVAPAPAPVVQAPPPPPAPVCNKGPYIVFFDWDKSDITAEAATILDSAVSAYGNCSRVPVMVAGYADRSGSPKYNQGLSERRASNIRGYLTSHGIADMAISTQGFGENNNRVPTADGVKELQNRRVEISYGPGSGN